MCVVENVPVRTGAQRQSSQPRTLSIYKMSRVDPLLEASEPADDSSGSDNDAELDPDSLVCCVSQSGPNASANNCICVVQIARTVGAVGQVRRRPSVGVGAQVCARRYARD